MFSIIGDCWHHHHCYNHHCNHFETKSRNKKEQFRYSLYESIRKYEYYIHRKQRQFHLNRLNDHYNGRVNEEYSRINENKIQIIRPRSMSH